MKKQSRNEKGSYSLIGLVRFCTLTLRYASGRWLQPQTMIERCESEIQSRRRFFIIFFQGCNAIQSDYNHMVVTLTTLYIPIFSVIIVQEIIRQSRRRVSRCFRQQHELTVLRMWWNTQETCTQWATEWIKGLLGWRTYLNRCLRLMEGDLHWPSINLHFFSRLFRLTKRE